jgi:HrpA-like RNA helicase
MRRPTALTAVCVCTYTHVQAAVQAAVDIHCEDLPGDILIFLTGQVGLKSPFAAFCSICYVDGCGQHQWAYVRSLFDVLASLLAAMSLPQEEVTVAVTLLEEHARRLAGSRGYALRMLPLPLYAGGSRAGRSTSPCAAALVSFCFAVSRTSKMAQKGASGGPLPADVRARGERCPLRPWPAPQRPAPIPLPIFAPGLPGPQQAAVFRPAPRGVRKVCGGGGGWGGGISAAAPVVCDAWH